MLNLSGLDNSYVSITGMSDMLKHQVLQQRAQVPLEQPDLTSSVELYEHWFYQDPQGKLQGPFTAQEMAEWFSAGYFTMNLPVKQGKGRVFQVCLSVCLFLSVWPDISGHALISLCSGNRLSSALWL